MPNTLIYRTHEPAKIAEQLEERVRADLGAQMRVPFEIQDANQQERGGSLKDLGRLMVGANLEARIATITFTLPWHRPASLAVVATRFTFSALCALLFYEVNLARPIDGVIGFAKKTFTAADDGAAAGAKRLNAVQGLSKQVHDALREQAMFGTLVVRQPTHFSIEPGPDGARLLIRTLGKQSGLLIAKGTTSAGEILVIARAIESAL